MTHLVIIADDLTGAADTSAAFADAGLSTVISLDPSSLSAADVVIVSTECRDLPAAEAARRVGTLAARFAAELADGHPDRYYKKIDSALRGHPQEELLALIEALGERRAVVAPAFPAEGRTTARGRQFVAGIPVEESQHGAWRRLESGCALSQRP